MSKAVAAPTTQDLADEQQIIVEVATGIIDKIDANSDNLELNFIEVTYLRSLLEDARYKAACAHDFLSARLPESQTLTTHAF